MRCPSIKQCTWTQGAILHVCGRSLTLFCITGVGIPSCNFHLMRRCSAISASSGMCSLRISDKWTHYQFLSPRSPTLKLDESQGTRSVVGLELSTCRFPSDTTVVHLQHAIRHFKSQRRYFQAFLKRGIITTMMGQIRERPS